MTLINGTFQAVKQKIHTESLNQVTCRWSRIICTSLSMCKQWSNDGSRVFSRSWVRTPSTVPSCWTSATRRLWRTQSTTASSSATWTWSPWTTATSTTATTSRGTSPSPWTSLASGEAVIFNSACDFSHTHTHTHTLMTAYRPALQGIVPWRMFLQVVSAPSCLFILLLLCISLSQFVTLVKCKYVEFKYAIGSLIDNVLSLSSDRQLTIFNVTKSHYTLKSLSEA